MQKNYKTFIKCIAVTAIVVFLIIHFAIRTYNNGNPWELETIWGDIGYTSAIIFFLAILFDRLLWRIPFVGRWLHTPNISGEWLGKGKSSFNDTEYEFKLKICQSFLETHVHGFFGKSRSDSFGSVFIHDGILDRTLFVYSYLNDPKFEYRNKAEKGEDGGLSIHYGSAKLDIDYADLTRLAGTYWNDRNCTGSWELTKKI